MLISEQDQTARVIITAEDHTGQGLDQVKESLDSTSKAAKRASAELAGVSKAAGKTGGGVQGFFADATSKVEEFSASTTGAVDAIGDFGAALQKAFVPATAAIAALVAAYNAVDAAADKAFNVRNAASTLQIDVSKARDALGGLVAEYDLAAVANKGFAMGVVTNGDEFADLARGISEIAKQSGDDLDYLMESAIVGIGRKSTAVLDNLNVVLTQETAELKYAEALGKTVDQLTEYEKSQAFAKVAIQEIAGAARDSTKANKDLATSWKQGKTALQELSDAGFGFTNVGGKIREVLRNLDASALQAFGSGRLEDIRRIERALEGTGVTYEQIREYVADINNIETDGIFASQKSGEIRQQIAKGLQGIAGEALKYQDKQIANAEILAKQAEREAQLKADAAAVSDAEFEIERLEAMGAAQAEIVAAQENSLILQIEQAEAANDLLKIKELERKLELVQLGEETRKRKAGGQGVTQAERVRAINEAITQELADQVTVMELQASLSGKAGDSELAIARAKLDLAHQQLEAELEVLSVTRSKNAVERTRNAAREQEVLRQMEILDLQTMVADRKRETELIAEAVALSQAKARSTASEASRVAELADAQAAAQTMGVENARALAVLHERNAVRRVDLERSADAALAQIDRQRIQRAHNTAQAEFAAREAAVLAMPGGSDEERLAQEDAQKQLMHDREIERLNYEMEVRRNMEAEKISMLQSEQARREAQLGIVTESIGQFENFRNAVAQVYGTATQLANERADAELQATLASLKARGDAQKAHADAEIAAAKGNAGLQAQLRRDQAKREAALQKQVEQTQAAHNEKRKKAEMRYQGAMLMITGAVEAVQAAVSYASLNIPQGVAHTVASVAAFAQGAMLLAGNVPGGGGAGAVAAAPAADTRDTGTGNADPSMVPGSTPRGSAADQDAGMRATGRAQGGGTTIVINGGVSAWGSIDADATENIAREIDRLSRSREA